MNDRAAFGQIEVNRLRAENTSLREQNAVWAAEKAKAWRVANEARRELQQAQQQLSDENAKRLAAESRIAAVESLCNRMDEGFADVSDFAIALIREAAAPVVPECEHDFHVTTTAGAAMGQKLADGSGWESCSAPVVATPAEPQQDEPTCEHGETDWHEVVVTPLYENRICRGPAASLDTQTTEGGTE